MELILIQQAEPAGWTVDAVARRVAAEGGWDALYAAGRQAADVAAVIGAATGMTPTSSSATADAVEALITDRPGQRVLVCTCSQVIDEMVRRAFGVADQVVRSPDPTGITRIMASRAGHREIVSLNDTAHLRGGEPPRESLNHYKTGKVEP